MLARWEREQRRKGNEAAADQAQLLLEKYGDIPLSECEITTAEFTEKQRQELEDRGYKIYPLTGHTIATLREAGHPFWSVWHQGETIEKVRSKLTEVAVNPKSLFLPDSSRKTFDEQMKMVQTFRIKLSSEIEGVPAVLGTAPDYAELAFSHFSATGERLFGEDYGRNYTRTITPTGGSCVALVGHFRADSGLHVNYWARDDRSDLIWAAPLVVPVAAVSR